MRALLGRPSRVGGDRLGVERAGIDVHAGAGLPQIDDDQPDDQGHRGHDLEVDQRLDADPADLLHVLHAGDAVDDGAEDDRRDQHLDQLDERIAERLHLLRRSPGRSARAARRARWRTGPGRRDAGTRALVRGPRAGGRLPVRPSGYLPCHRIVAWTAGSRRPHGGQRRHVDQPADRAGRGQDMDRLRRAQQDRADRDACARHAFSALKVMLAASRLGMISRLASAVSSLVRHHPVQRPLGQRRIRVHLAIDLEVRRHLLDQAPARGAS